MLLSVQRALQQQGESLPFAVDMPMDPIEFRGDDISFTRDVHVSGQMMGIEDRITLEGTIVASMRSTCVRCLGDAFFTLSIPFTEKYLREADEDEPDAFLYESSAVDLDQMVLGNLVMNMPTQILCKDTCKGLCPKCGKDLNEGPCNCDLTPVNPAFAALGALKLEEDETAE